MFYVLVPCLVLERLPFHASDSLHSPVQTAQDPLSKLGREASLALGNPVHSTELELEKKTQMCFHYNVETTPSFCYLYPSL